MDGEFKINGNYVKSPMNYLGGKYKLLEDIIPCFPDGIRNFVDLFAGGLNVGINVSADTIYVNDRITYLIDLYKMFRETPIDTLFDEIRQRIARFGLTRDNQEGYIALRDEYNQTHQTIDLFVLTCYSFDNQIRFNNSFEFNTSFGMRCFNDSIKANLIQFCSALKSKKIVFSTDDFRNFDFSILSAGDMVYCDPPYLITTATYNDGKRGFGDWTETEDAALMSLLDSLNANGILFAMSNVLEHKGMQNDDLIEWSKKYHITHIEMSYSSCNYQFKDRDSKTVEVLITNYPCNVPKRDRMKPKSLL